MLDDPYDKGEYQKAVNPLVADVHSHQSWIRTLRKQRRHAEVPEAYQKLKQLSESFMQKVADFIERHLRFAVQQLTALGNTDTPNPFDDARQAVLESASRAVSLDQDLAISVSSPILQRFREAKAAYDLEAMKLRKARNQPAAVEAKPLPPPGLSGKRTTLTGFSGIEADSSVEEQWQGVAARIAAVIRVRGLEGFRKAVRQVARERFDASDEKDRREEARRQELKKNGVWYGIQALPPRPDREWFDDLDVIRGCIKLPPGIALPPQPPERPVAPACLRDGKPRKDRTDSDRNELDTYNKALEKFKEAEREFWPNRAEAMLPVFDYVKAEGFPNNKDGDFEYSFEVCGWLPSDLHPDRDWPTYGLLPVPKRALTDAEKTTVLAAVYDAYWRGDEKIAPWGVSEKGDGPAAWPSEAEHYEKRAAAWYYLLVYGAERLGPGDLPIVRGWLDELRLTVGQTGAVASEPAGVGKTEKKSWAKAQKYLEECRMKGERFTTERELAGRIGCSPATVHKAIMKGSVELVEWAKGQQVGTPFRTLGAMAGVVFDTTPQTREADPASVMDNGDVDAILAQLLDEAGPDERARINAMTPAEQRQLADIASRDPDLEEQALRYRRNRLRED